MIINIKITEVEDNNSVTIAKKKKGIIKGKAAFTFLLLQIFSEYQISFISYKNQMEKTSLMCATSIHDIVYLFLCFK